MVRTVTVSKNDAYLQSFNEYHINESEERVDFRGSLPFNEDLVKSFDNVALCDIEEYQEYDTIVQSSFDMEKMQFTFYMALVDKDNNIVDEESMITDAFVTQNGGIDAYIEIENQTYLLSEYQAKLQASINDCGLFSWLIATVVVVVVVVVYVVVAETAEQIRSKSNYTYNKNLESSGLGVYKGNYITNQSNSTKKGYKSANYRFGFTTFGDVGCEVASIYNLLISIGKAEMLSETINNVEKWAIEFSVGWGMLGSNPNEISRYLDKKGIAYSKYTTYESFKESIDKKSSCKFIMSSWCNGGLLQSIFNGLGLHTYFCEKGVNVKIKSYNLRYYDSFLEHKNIDELYSYGGNFIVAYIIV